MNNKEFAAKLKDIAENYKTLYVLGCFGAPLKSSNKNRYCNNYAYNKKPERTAMIMAASDDTFGFDCVCLLKGVLWGWNGDVSKPYGGAAYQSNGVPDIDESSMINRCSELSTNFDDIEIGEAVWMKGHIGAYIGNGLAVECTPKWKNCVQITACNRDVPGYNRRDWTKHGKLPYIEYVKEEAPKVEPVTGTASTGSAADEKAIWDFLKSKGLNDYAVAGVMGNLYAECALRSNNLQQSYERSLGYTDDTYTAAVDNGSYTNFVRDSAGYGLAQWTYWSRKEALLKFAQAANKSIGDFNMQLNFLWNELQGYTVVMNVLKNAKSIREASDAILTGYERPADQGESVQVKRTSYGQNYYDKYAVKPVEPEKPVETPKTVKVGDVVKIATGAIYYDDKKVVPSWVIAKQWTVEKVNGDRVVVNKSTDGKSSILSPVHVKYLTIVSTTQAPAEPVKPAEPAKPVEQPKPVEPPKPATPALKYKVGDIVDFKGSTHYTSSNSTSPKSCKGGKAKVTAIYATGKHPYHLIRESGSGATVYGWVDAADIADSVVANKKSNEEVAREVIQGKWKNYPERKTLLEAADYNYAEIQALVNKMLR